MFYPILGDPGQLVGGGEGLGEGEGKRLNEREKIRAKKSQEREEDPEHDHFKVLFYLRATLYNPQNDLIS